MQKIIFIPNERWPSPEKRGSSLMRAYILSNHIKKIFEIESICSRTLPLDVKKNDIVIFVKDQYHSNIKLANSKKCIVVYDPIDDYSNIANPSMFDLVIASSESHAEQISSCNKIDRKKVIIIDHLHTNVNRLKANKRKNIYEKSVVGTVCYSKTAMLTNSEYQSFLNSSKFEFKLIDLTNVSLSMSKMGDVNNLFDCYKSIHIGLNIHNHTQYKYHLEYKPTTAMSAYASYDIPVISTYQNSMKNILTRYHQFSDFIVENAEDSKPIINRLIDDYEYYEKSRLLFHEIGEMFHMDNAYKAYIELINKTILS